MFSSWLLARVCWLTFETSELLHQFRGGGGGEDWHWHWHLVISARVWLQRYPVTEVTVVQNTNLRLALVLAAGQGGDELEARPIEYLEGANLAFV